MTEHEWNESHPQQCDAYFQAWETKRKRELSDQASDMLIHCQIHGVKINGRKPRHEDFMPAKKRSPKAQANLLKAIAQVADIQSQKRTK
jgi:hypothetical protein